MFTKISNRVFLIVIVLTQMLTLYLEMKNAKDLTASEEMGATTMLLLLQTLCWGGLIISNIKRYFENKTKMGNVLMMLIAFIGLTSFHVLYEFPSPVMYAKSFVFSGLTYCAFFACYLVVKSDNTIVRFYIYLYSLFFLSIVVVYPSYYKYLMQYATTGIVLQDSMYMLMLLPIMLSFKMKILRYLALFVVVAVVVVGAKRSALIILAGVIPIYFLIQNIFIDRKHRVISILLIPFLISAFGILFWYYLQSHDFALSRLLAMSDDEGSGRLEIWSTYMGAISNSDIMSCLFGHGIFGSVDIFGYKKSAHNEILETIYSLGLIGFAMYVAFVYLLFKKAYDIIMARSLFAPAYSIAIVIFFVLSAVSMLSTMPSYPIILYSYLGMIFSLQEDSHSAILNSRR